MLVKDVNYTVIPGTAGCPGFAARSVCPGQNVGGGGGDSGSNGAGVDFALCPAGAVVGVQCESIDDGRNSAVVCFVTCT